MTNPQQPELARSRRYAATEDSAKPRAQSTLPRSTDTGVGSIPPENQPGHHPDVEQDKPTGPPRLPAIDHRFDFAFDRRIAPVARVFGVRPDTASVEVTDDELSIRFGPWKLQTTIDNVESAERTGPYAWWKVAGPPHLSVADRGITFATTTREGVCIRFRDPVPAALPHGLLRHPGATVTVEDADDLVRLLNR